MVNSKLVVGVMCVSGLPEILNISIPNLIKHSDYVLLILDNEIEEVKNLVLNYQRKFYDKVFVRRSSIPGELINRKGDILSAHKRWKSCKEIVRDEMFVNIRRMVDMNLIEKPDILLIPDADEIFTDYLLELLEEFWNSEYMAVALKMIHVVNDLYTIKDDIMRHHVHILKWQNNLRGIPWQFQNQMHPIKWEETMKVENYSVHLCYLTEQQRQWRNNNWKSVDQENWKLYKLPKIVTEMSPEEITNILNYEKLA